MLESGCHVRLLTVSVLVPGYLLHANVVFYTRTRLPFDTHPLEYLQILSSEDTSRCDEDTKMKGDEVPSITIKFCVILLYITLMRNMFRLKYKQPSSGELIVPNESCHVNYIKPLFMSVCIVQI